MFQIGGNTDGGRVTGRECHRPDRRSAAGRTLVGSNGGDGRHGFTEASGQCMWSGALVRRGPYRMFRCCWSEEAPSRHLPGPPRAAEAALQNACRPRERRPPPLRPWPGGGGRWPVPHGVGRESTRNTGTYSTMHLSTCLPMVIQSSERSREPARLRSLMAVPAFYRRVSTLH